MFVIFVNILIKDIKMLKIIKHFAYKMSNREYYNELYVVPIDVSEFECALIIDEIVEDIIYNIEKYLNGQVIFKLNNNFKVVVIFLNNLNDLNDLNDTWVNSFSIITYRSIIPNVWKHIFIYEFLFGDGILKLNDFSETHFENSSNIKNTEYYEEGILHETTTDKLVYIENEIFKLDKHKMNIFLKMFIYGNE